jgi:class 3 adenylate cyclase/tetratricopeptide (TPR) repeat protein
VKCSSCGTENPADYAFCRSCGEKLFNTCPGCGDEVPPGDAFCGKCGTKIAMPDSTEPSAVPDLERQFSAFRDSLPSTMANQLMAPSDGENRLVTVLFADMSNSVATTEGMAPDEAAELVNKLLKAMVDAFTRYEGRVDRFLGDGALAVFGTPYTHENDPERAILAAQEIREKAQELGLQVTGGINTGRVYFGEMGSDDHRELTVMGPVVNLAARIQGEAEAGEVLIGETTQRHVRRAFELTRREVEIKGIDGTVPVYRVEKQLPRMQKTRGLEGVTAELIGRDEELARLIEAFELAASGEGQLVCVVGEAGLGKTRLVAELCRHVEKAQKPPLWLEGRCVELDVSPSYWPFTDLFREYFGLSRQDEAGAPAQKIRFILQSLAAKASFTESRLREIGWILGRLLSVRFGDDWDHVLDGADSEVIRNMTFLAIRDLMLALANDSPVIVVLDDLHWADGISIDMISLLMESLTLAPLLVVSVYRPDREHRCFQIPTVASRKCPERFAEISLKELSPAECRRMIQSLLAVGDLPSELRTMILEKSQGNPLFVEEVIRSLIDSGAIYPEGDEWKTSTDIAEVAVPETVQGIILSRVDRLDESLKHLLQSAAVIGRIFGRRLLKSVSKQERDLDESLGELEDHSLIYQERAVPEQEYAFKHVMARDAVYDGIVKRTRVQFHAQVAEAMMMLYADALDENHEQLAYHYERAGDPISAVEHLVHAAERALEQHALRSADDLYDRISILMDESVNKENRRRAVLLRGRGKTRVLRGKSRDGIPDLIEAYRVFRKIGDNARAVALASDHVCESDMHDVLIDALPLCDRDSIEASKISLMLHAESFNEAPIQQALRAAREHGDRLFEVVALRAYARLLQQTNRVSEQDKVIEQAVNLCREYDLRYEMPSLMFQVAERFARTDRVEYVRRANQAIAAAHELGLASVEAGMYRQMAWWEPDHDRKVKLFEQGLRAAPDMLTSISLSGAYRQSGGQDKSIEVLEEAMQMLRNQEILPEDNGYLWMLGRMIRNTRDLRLLGILEESLQYQPEPVDDDSLNFVQYRAGQAIFAALRNELSSVDEITFPIHKSIEKNSIRNDNHKWVIQVHYYPLSICAEAKGNLDQAIENLEIVLETSEDRDFLILCAEMYVNRGKPGDISRARDLLQIAATEMTRLDVGAYTQWREEVLARIEATDA